MALPVFKTGEAEHLGLAGSIPVRLRHRLVGVVNKPRLRSPIGHVESQATMRFSPTCQATSQGLLYTS